MVGGCRWLVSCGFRSGVGWYNIDFVVISVFGCLGAGWRIRLWLWLVLIVLWLLCLVCALDGVPPHGCLVVASVVGGYGCTFPGVVGLCLWYFRPVAGFSWDFLGDVGLV